MNEAASRQVIGTGRARYELVDPPRVEPDVCCSCGGDIVEVAGAWYALEAYWPNLAYCHRQRGSSVGHTPELRLTARNESGPAEAGPPRPERAS